MKVLKKNIIRAVAAALALCVAGTAIYINTNTAPQVIDHKMPDYFELTDRSSIGFDGAYFIELAYLSSAEEFLDYTIIDDTDTSGAVESESDNSDSSVPDDENNNDTDFSGSDDAYDDADYNDDNEQDGVPDEEYTDTDIADEDSEQTDDDTTIPPQYENTDEGMFIVNEFDMLTKYNGTDETVVIPENVKEIAGHAFDGNEFVQRIVLHTTIESLLIDAFVGCPNLTEIFYEGSSEEWENVYKAPDSIPDFVAVTVADPEETSEDTTAETTAPVEETTEDTAAETTAPVEETTEDTTAETTAPVEESAEDTTAETTAPAEESTEETTAETTAPVEETTEETTAETTAPVDETTEETTAEITAPVDETTEETTAETTAPAEETTEETTAKTTAPVEETTEDTTSETTAPVDETTEDTTAETSAPVEETTEETSAETTVPVDETTEETTAETTASVEETTEETTAETTAPVEETTEDTTAETTAPVEETADNTEDTTQPSEVKESKTVSLVSQLAGINDVKTKIAARMSYFPTSSVITVTNTDAAALYAKEALQLLDSDVISYYAFDISVFDADTSEKIHELGGDVTFDIGVPDILADSENIKVYHINSGYPELLESEIVTNNDGARMVEFSASSFSPFVFAAEADSTSVTTANETTEPKVTSTSEASDESTDEAEDSAEENTEETTTSDDDEPVIKVTFPASTSYIINPYHLDVKVSDGETSNAAIISPEMKITSESNCKVAVYMSAVAQNVPDTVRLSETYLTKGETEKSLFLYVEAADDNNAYRNYYDGSANQIVVSQNGGQSQKILELDEPEEGSYTEGQFKIFGETFMPRNDLWRENETVGVLMVFRVEAVN
ncbi:MAG: hypothetical protein IK990_19710 [Ruminiclostridium sp.]|nr:hypothetical protein [Ruminiclostridium sp.]